ncbi:S10 family peptidase [Stratiformator vulcanicus]|uniref:Serine carboxypeptidase n=1 Tax=Stratiformator vulcanicus TaxID=2527980 RepID=A0A517R1I6_9PLAN|nr:hypothetical protein [Stratiformator vulcanicus]QDT37759.1 Serine carboxypeptidase [Stratiformator vulcanicus]
MMRFWLILALASFLFPSVVTAQEDVTVTLEAPTDVSEPAAEPDGSPKSQSRSVRIAGESIEYQAIPDTLTLKDDKGEPRAKIFFAYYRVKQEADAPERPITFCFNGGPGSASVWLHMGMLGPKRLVIDSDAGRLPPPHGYIDNEFSLLDVTDLVFVDPVGTGYSKATDPKKKGDFYGFRKDLKSLAEFIQLFVTKNERWGSPKFLLGESYGTLRVAGLARELQNTYRMEINGLVLVSSVLDFRTIRASGSNDLPYILFLPTLTATAWYHEQLDDGLQKDLAKTVEQARKFAFGEYATALLKGADLPKKKRRRVAERFAKLTGLDAEYILDANLRVDMSRFAKELLEEQQVSVGRFDSRYTGPVADLIDDRYDTDASSSALFGAFTSVVNQYFREDLGVKRDEPYEILARLDWDWDSENGYVTSADMLSAAMRQNPALKVFVANGYYDLATPFAATEYTFNHLTPRSLREHVTMEYYEAGHMMYVHEPSLEKLRTDLVKYFEAAIPSQK